MNPELILLIVLEGLKLANAIIEGIPVEQRQAWWRENQKTIEELQKLFERLRIQTPEKPEVPRGKATT